MRERAVRCVYCPRKVWSLHPVCRSRHCRRMDAMYKVRLEGTSARSLNGAETGAVGSLLGRLLVAVPVSRSQETT